MIKPRHNQNPLTDDNIAASWTDFLNELGYYDAGDLGTVEGVAERDAFAGRILAQMPPRLVRVARDLA